MNKKVLFILLCFFLLKLDVFGLTYNGCDYSTISKMKSLVTNVNITYDYEIVNGEPRFSVTLTNVFEGTYFVDSNGMKKYYYSDTNNGEITITNYDGRSGSYRFYSALADCEGTSLGKKYYSFPAYNTYYGSDECKDIPNFSLCQKWVNTNYGYDKFKTLADQYRKKLEESSKKKEELVEYNPTFLDRIIEIYVNNYFYFLLGIIFVCGIIIIIKRRKDSFKL